MLDKTSFYTIKVSAVSKTKVISALALASLLVGCSATQPKQLTQQQKEAAIKNKGAVVSMNASLDDSFSRRCGHTRGGGETIGCSLKILRENIEAQATNYCGKFTMGELDWQQTFGLYPRATYARAKVTCIGLEG